MATVLVEFKTRGEAELLAALKQTEAALRSNLELIRKIAAEQNKLDSAQRKAATSASALAKATLSASQVAANAARTAKNLADQQTRAARAARDQAGQLKLAATAARVYAREAGAAATETNKTDTATENATTSTNKMALAVEKAKVAYKAAQKAISVLSTAYGVAADAARKFTESSLRGATELDKIQIHSRLTAAGLTASLSDLQQATRGTVSDADLRRIALFSEQMRFSKDETAKMIRAAEVLSVKTGRDLFDAFQGVSEEIAGLTAGTEFERLGGNVVQIEAQMDDFAKSIGKAGAAALSDQEKRTFLLEAAVDRADSALAVFGERASDDVRSLDAAWKDFVSTVEQGSAQAFAGAAEVASDFRAEVGLMFQFDNLDEDLEAIKRFDDALAAHRAELSSLSGKIATAGVSAEELTKARDALTDIGKAEQELVDLRIKRTEANRAYGATMFTLNAETISASKAIVDGLDEQIEAQEIALRGAKLRSVEALNLGLENGDLIHSIKNQTEAEELAKQAASGRLFAKRRELEQQLALLDTQIKQNGEMSKAQKAVFDIRKRSLEIQQATAATVKSYEEFEKIAASGTFAQRAFAPLLAQGRSSLAAIRERQRAEAEQAKKKADDEAKRLAEQRKREAERIKEQQKRIIDEARVLGQTELAAALERRAKRLEIAKGDAETIKAANRLFVADTTKALGDELSKAASDLEQQQRSIQGLKSLGETVRASLFGAGWEDQGLAGEARGMISRMLFGGDGEEETLSQTLQGIADQLVGINEIMADFNAMQLAEGPVLQRFQTIEAMISSLGSNWEALAGITEGSIGTVGASVSAMAQIVGAGLLSETKDIRKQAGIKGAMEIAESFASFATGNIVGGALHALAATKFFLVAGGVIGTSSGAGAGASQSSSASPAASGRSTALSNTRDDRRSRSQQQAQEINNTFILRFDPGSAGGFVVEAANKEARRGGGRRIDSRLIGEQHRTGL